MIHNFTLKIFAYLNVVSDEECVQQHNLVVCDFSMLIPRPKKRKFTPRIRSWKLRDQAVANEFKGVFTEKVTATQPNNPAETVEDVWAGLKKSLLEASTEVCGLSKQDRLVMLKLQKRPTMGQRG